MLNYFRKIFATDSSESIDVNKKLQIATCALFVEMAKSDSDFSSDEKELIVSIMKLTFNLDDEEADELIELAEADIKDSISYYEFTTILDQNFSREEKYELMKNLWRLIYVDKKLDKYEDQLVKRLGGMLNLDFQDIIDAKMTVKKQINGV